MIGGWAVYNDWVSQLTSWKTIPADLAWPPNGREPGSCPDQNQNNRPKRDVAAIATVSPAQSCWRYGLGQTLPNVSMSDENA